MNIPEILIEKYPGAQWSLIGETYDGLEWLDDSPKPTQEELEALWPEVENESKLTGVQEARRQAYMRESDPLFFKYQAGEATEKEWLDARAAVVAAHPYPEPIIQTGD